MKTAIKSIKILFVLLLLVGCGNSEKSEEESIQLGDYDEAPQQEKSAETEPEAGGDDLSNKGIGPIKSLDVDDEINQDMASKGEDIFKNMCSACHKMDKKFIGPALDGVTERRSHEWVMNMILNPEEMIKNDPIAKRLLVESNMAVMADQNLTEEEARAILEYFRKNDQEN